MDTHTSGDSSSPLDRRILLGAAGLAGIAALASGRAKAGPLNPPAGAVASTGKTITEAEPRTAINSVNTPGDATNIYRITSAGSYYLTDNMLIGPGKSGIFISASGVTIDLNGFQISAFGGDKGIVATNTALEGIVIRNGRIHQCAQGIALFSTPGVTLERLRIELCTGRGAEIGLNGRIVECTFAENGGHGVFCREGLVATHSTFKGNTGVGLYVQYSSQYGPATVTDCLFEDNTQTGLACRGVISRCSAIRNGTTGISADHGSTVTDCSACENGQYGIFVRESMMTACSASENGIAGFSIYFYSRVSGCNAEGNGSGSTSTSAAGFMLNGRFSSLTDCHAANNIVGFRTATSTADSNFIARNTAASNDTNWSIASGNICLVVAAASAAAITGDSGGASPGSTNPNANYSTN